MVEAEPNDVERSKRVAGNPTEKLLQHIRDAVLRPVSILIEVVVPVDSVVAREGAMSDSDTYIDRKPR